MDKLKVYIETTIFNRYFEDGREFANESKALFEKVAAGQIEACTSLAVLEELERAPEPKRAKMLDLVTSSGITILEVDEQAYDLAGVYVEMGIIPARFRMDGIHIAMASVYGMDCIIS